MVNEKAPMVEYGGFSKRNFKRQNKDMGNDLATVDTSPAMLLQMAIKQDLDIEKLERLMALNQQWEAQQAKKKFYEALSKFQSIIPPLKKNKTANINSQKGAFKYKYADLGGITESIKKHLQECGLTYRWEFSEEKGKHKVTCFISHIDGHTESTSMEADNDDSGAKNRIQQAGSTHTYLQRYTLIGALGLSTADEDNDGKSVQPQPQQTNTNMSDEDVMEQWKTSIAQVKTRIELTKLYSGNKKTVDGNEALKCLFKEREDELRKIEVKQTISML